MKRILSVGVIAVLLFSSCDEILDKLNITFETGPHNVKFDIDPASKGDLFASEDVVYHEIKKEVEDNGGDFEKLDLVTLTEATVSIISGASNFNAFESVDVFIETPNLSAKKIGWVSSVPFDVATIEAELSPDNLKEYMQEGEFTVTIKGILREDVTQTVKLQADIYFDINL